MQKTEIDKLEEWMKANGYSISSLAKALGYSYDGVYQAVVFRKRLSGDFKWSFLDAFGVDVARKIFDQSTTVAVAETV